jgi:hypothetical protein
MRRYFAPVNLQDELQKEKLVQQARLLLEEAAVHDQVIIDSLQKENEPNILSLLELNAAEVYSLAEIEKICIRHRLRFLPSKHFNARFPYEAIEQIKLLENKYHCTLSDFHIMAPASLFKLEDPEKDPVLFARINESQFLFIHKWGRDMSPLRRLIVYPLRNLESYVTFLISFVFMLSMLVPENWLMRTDAMKDQIVQLRILFFFHYMILLGGMSIFFGFSFYKNFSESVWKSKYIY